MMITACASAVCFNRELNILNLSDREPIQTPEVEVVIPAQPAIDIKMIQVTPRNATWYLSEVEQLVFSRTLLRSVDILDEGEIV